MSAPDPRPPSATAARAPLELPLWPTPASPTMRVVFPRERGAVRSTALVVFRGGGYATSRGSGGGSAEWAAAHGMLGVEVDYRTPASGPAFPAAFADAARAMRLVRRHADAWAIDSGRVGALGFSAGGHLASLLSTQPRCHLDAADELVAIDPRPDFVILAYPVISFVEGYGAGAYAGSATKLLGPHALDEATRRAFSSERHVAPDHPPVFVWTTADDELVPASHARCFAEACERAAVPFRLRVYPHGPHGMGLALDRSDDVAGWTHEALAWLDEARLRLR